MSKAKNKKKWTRYRHGIVRNILSALLGPYCKLKYGIKVDRFAEQEKRPYLVLFNHQTAYDQFFVGMAFKGPIYYLASEDLFSNGFLSSVIRFLVAPIPIKKQTTDIRAILNCIKVAKEGGTIAIAPEGNRTYSGRTEYMSDSIVPLAKKLGLPIALYRIEGGYGVHPRWSDVVRRGKMRGYVSKVIYPEEFSSLSDAELFELIKTELYVDESHTEKSFKHKKKAEYLERALYVCPFCGLSEFESCGELISCKKCGKQIIYTEDMKLRGTNCEFPYTSVAQWYDAQADYINAFDVCELSTDPVFTESAEFRKVIPYKNKISIFKKAKVELYGNKITVSNGEESYDFPFDSTSAVTVLGRNKLNIYSGENIYQLRPPKRFNALKYVHFYNRYKNIIKGEENVKFLGL